MSFGEEIKEIRNTKKLTLDELSKRTGLSKGYLSKLENGKRDIPKAETIKRLAEGLEVSSFELLYDAGHISKEDVQKKIQDMATKMQNISRELIDQTEEYLNIPNLKEFLIQDNNIRWENQPLSIEDRQKIVDFIQEKVVEKQTKRLVIEFEDGKPVSRTENFDNNSKKEE
ncbi:helix-turn-helix transcriptional regulator [Gracilibacillus sp. S3-1-1]|uniref:Helix-turn-helix transcriptional regulator n=1 Tax=Gracilibacillus pellucidus TaxID=3095368 RepID=A0ACC6M3H1_9BACI|nr:helix-turn-helix transcriptional regulator [Gracilibacillus sp. S3-1-1]MDX8045453.1 helix-turn-helix transcriptional regulator [Gracilibacillus sp. S3-1-1]